MSRKRWIISYLGLDESGIRTFKIRAPEQKEYEAEQVWYSNGRVRCVGCSGPLSAMLSTCEHANAVRRAIRAGKFPDVPPLPVAGQRHRSVPPASAPAATAEPETIRCAGCGRECEPIADDDSPVTHCVDCYRRAAPTGEKAEDWRDPLACCKRLEEVCTAADASNQGPAMLDLAVLWGAYTAQATELAALRKESQTCAEDLCDAWEEIRRLRAALAPRQTTGGER